MLQGHPFEVAFFIADVSGIIGAHGQLVARFCSEEKKPLPARLNAWPHSWRGAAYVWSL